MATILILDDEQDVRDFLCTLLSKQGHHPVPAADAQQAMSLFLTECPQLVIADFVMPGVDGFSFIRQLRTDTIGRTVPVIIYTAALIDQEMHALAEACGVEIILEKTSVPQVILDAVKKAIGSAPGIPHLPADVDRGHLHVLASQLAKKVQDLQKEVDHRRQLEANLRVSEKTLRETAERLKSVSRRVLEIQESERRHLARELHDEIGQVLSAISVNLKLVKTKIDSAAVPRLEESIQIVDIAIDQVRNLSLDLHPSVLDDFGLESALRWYVDRLSARTEICIRFQSEPHASEIPVPVRTTCYRVAQEALTNVVRHASAREVQIDLVQHPTEIVLTICDDGKGFDVEDAYRRASRGGSLGLLGMQERVELLDGKAHFHSEPGKGTTVQIQLPLAVSAAAPHEERVSP